MSWNLKPLRDAAVGSIAVVALSAGTAARADNTDQLEAQLRIMQDQIRHLQQQIEDNRAEARAQAEKQAAKKKDDLDLKVKWKGAPELSSKDGKYKMKVRGRLNVDYNAIDQDQAITNSPDVSAAELRRARLGVEGVIAEDTKYKFEIDFASDTTAVKDAYFEYTGWGPDFRLRVGNFKTFNSLEHIMSANFIEFMERAAFIEAFGLDRQVGIGALYVRDHFTLAAGLYGPTVSNQVDWLQDMKTGAARITVAPINDEGHVLHLAASWRQRHGAQELRTNIAPLNDQFFTYRARGANLHLANRFIATPAIFNRDTFWGLEAAYVWGPWSIQGEYAQLHGDVAPLFAGQDPTYTGGYVEVSWFLTSETRPYKEGEFVRQQVLNPVNEGGHGAWQLVARYDTLNLKDNATTIAACVTCGIQNTWQAGVNWWLNDYTRVMLNYGESSIGGGFLAGANRNDDAKIKGFGSRLQIDW